MGKWGSNNSGFAWFKLRPGRLVMKIRLTLVAGGQLTLILKSENESREKIPLIYPLKAKKIFSVFADFTQCRSVVLSSFSDIPSPRGVVIQWLCNSRGCSIGNSACENHVSHIYSNVSQKVRSQIVTEKVLLRAGFLKPSLFIIVNDSVFLFFAIYEIYKKNYSFSRVFFLFLFYLTKIANSFYSKINDSGRCRTTRFSSSGFGVRVSALPKFFTIYP